MIGETWWSRMVNAVRFLDDAMDSLLSGKCVILNFPGEIPWRDLLTEALEQKLELFSDDRTFRIHSVKDVKDPGEYLFHHYCSEEERGKYWAPTHETYERFLAMSETTTLRHRYLCLTDITTVNASLWVKSVSDYTEACQEDEGAEYGLFILLSQGTNIKSTKTVDAYQYADYITDYDCLMFCQTLISSLSCSSTAKQYISEIASNIATNNVELAGLLVSHELDLIQNPESVTWEVFAQQDIPCEHLKEQVSIAVWEAQIKTIFPKLERFRREFIQKYQNKLQKFLPVIGSNGKPINKLNELELGELFFLCNGKQFIDGNDFRMLGKMRDARNYLAHWEVIPYGTLTKEMKLL